MAKGDPKVHSKDEDFSGTMHGSAHGAKMGPVGVSAHDKGELGPAGTHPGKVMAKGGAMASGNAGSMKHAVSHLKAHHGAKHHMVGKHKMG